MHTLRDGMAAARTPFETDGGGGSRLNIDPQAHTSSAEQSPSVKQAAAPQTPFPIPQMPPNYNGVVLSWADDRTARTEYRPE